MKSFWIVTKDIRCEDNLVLKMALHYSEEVYPLFILDQSQFLSGGSNSVHFLIESLQELHEHLKIYGSCLHIVEKTNLANFIQSTGINSAYILSGFTPFEKNREVEYSSMLNLQKIDDCLGMPRSYFLKADGTAYRVFSPYSRSILSKGGLPLPDNNIPPNINKCKKIDGFSDFNFLSLASLTSPKALNATWKGGSTEGKKICTNRYYNLQVFLSTKQYIHSMRERGDISPHVKFGTVSPRLVYHCGLSEADPLDKNNLFVDGKGILWRALYYNLMDQNMIILKERNIRWYNEIVPEQQWKYVFELWCTGNTGFDLIDAGINQLLKTGLMDNEIRMPVANFLVFVLGINWRYGEDFFRKHLVDYDWPLNVGNWAWCAQVGMDNPSPNKKYDGKAIRIFNPHTYKTKTKEEKNYRESYINKWLNRPINSMQPVCDFETCMRYNLQFYN